MPTSSQPPKIAPFENSVQAFSKRFEDDGFRVLFRASLYAAPVAVTRAEMFAQLDRFRRRCRLIPIVSAAPSILLIVAMVAGSISPRLMLPLVLGMGLLILAPFQVWGWRGPNRAFLGRPQAGPRLTAEERTQSRRTLWFSASWLQVAGTASALAIPLLAASLAGSPTSIELKTLKVVCAALLAMIGLLALMKFLGERRQR